MSKHYFTENLDRIFSLKEELAEEQDKSKKKELIEELTEATKNITKTNTYKDVNKLFRILFSCFIFIIFLLLNIFVIYLIYEGFHQDIYFLEKDVNYDRLINFKVILVLISGVVIETSIAFRLLAKNVLNVK